MISKIASKVKGYLIKIRNNNRYPFVFKMKEFNLLFNINNSIEEFRIIKWGGEKEYAISMINDLNEDDILFDVGSSVGLISLLSAKKLSKGKVISFEPDPEISDRLNKNYKINSLVNYAIQPIAVGDKKETLKLYTSGANGFSPSLQKVNGIKNFIEVPVNSIDNLIEQNIVPLPTVIKIDIEGAEMLALRGMYNLLKSSDRPRLIFLEIHPEFLPSFNTSVDEILVFLNGLNFKITEKIERDKQILCKLVRN